jgi:tRNA threonylcarbamoyladenosine biosynthesis protein TsaE
MDFLVSLEELDRFATDFWHHAAGYRVFLFYGEMGAGKTTTIAALCRTKGVKDTLSSPTFSIINEYSYPENGRPNVIYHLDLYRLAGLAEAEAAGVEDCLYSGAICFVEWPEKAPELFDGKEMKVFIEAVSPTERKIQLTPAGPQTSLYFVP